MNELHMKGEKQMHKLTIISSGKESKIMLDDFELQGISEYKVSSSSIGVTELEIKLTVKDSKIEI